MPDPLLYLESMGAAAIASALCVLAMAAWRRPAGTTRFNAACVLAMCLGIVAGNSVLSLGMTWPPANGLDRLMTVVIPAALAIELIAGIQRLPSAVAWFLRLGLAAATPRILLHGSVYLNGASGGWSAGEAVITLAAWSTLPGVLWVLLHWLSQRSCSGVSISLALALAIQSAGLTIMLAGYIKGGAAAIPLTATIATTAIGAGLAASRFAPAIVGVGVVNLFGVLFVGRFFGQISTGSALAILLAPLLCWATEIRQLRSRSPRLVGTLRLILVAIPLVVVLAVAKREFDRKMGPLLGISHSILNSSLSWTLSITRRA